MNLEITWYVFTWSKQAHNVIFYYFCVHLFLIIIHHAFKLCEKSLFKNLLYIASCFKGSKFWEPHCVFIFSWYLVKNVLYITELLLYLWFDLEVCSFPNWRFFRRRVTLRRYLLPNIIREKYDIFFVWTKNFKRLKLIYIQLINFGRNLVFTKP